MDILQLITLILSIIGSAYAGIDIFAKWYNSRVNLHVFLGVYSKTESNIHSMHAWHVRLTFLNNSTKPISILNVLPFDTTDKARKTLFPSVTCVTDKTFIARKEFSEGAYMDLYTTQFPLNLQGKTSTGIITEFISDCTIEKVDYLRLITNRGERVIKINQSQATEVDLTTFQ